MKAIIHANVVLEDRILSDGVIQIENGRIAEIGKTDAIKLLDACEIIDAENRFVGPGFVDIHCHAGGDAWAYEDPMRMARFHLAGGTTSLNCTIYHDIGEEGAIRAMKKIRKAMEENSPGNIMGIHFEGPFLNPGYGAMAKTIRPVDKREYRRYLAGSRRYSQDVDGCTRAGKCQGVHNRCPCRGYPDSDGTLGCFPGGCILGGRSWRYHMYSYHGCHRLLDFAFKMGRNQGMRL